MIAIIAILAAMLLPALGKAREKSREVSCLSNLKQVMLSGMQYADDNRGSLPIPYDGVTGRTWAKTLCDAKYLFPGNVLVCPSFGARRFLGDSGFGEVYGMRLGWDDSHYPRMSTNIMGSRICVWKYNPGAGVDEYAPSSQTVVFSDCIRQVDGKRMQWYSFFPFCSYQTLSTDGTPYAAHQADRVNCAFADGHVAAAGRADMRRTGGFKAYCSHQTDVIVKNL